MTILELSPAPLPSPPPDPLIDAAIDLTTRLSIALRRRGHAVAAHFDLGDRRYTARLAIDAGDRDGGDYRSPDRLGLRVEVDAGEDGRPVLVRVRWRGVGAGGEPVEVVRWGSAGEAATFADLDEVAGVISTEVIR